MKDVTRTSTLSGIMDKDSDVLEGIGSIDEANSFVGLAKVFSKNEHIRKILEEIQNVMFEAGAEFAQGEKFHERNYERILKTIDEIEKKVKKPRKFLILEQDYETAFLSVARSVVRRCERIAVSLYREEKVSELLVKWLNKLSYLLYLLILLKTQENEDESKCSSN